MRALTILRQGAAAIAVTAAMSLASAEPMPDAGGTLRRAPDHVLVWSQTAETAGNGFTAMGFIVSPGQVYPEGITGSTVVFDDWSYLELLFFSDPARAVGNAQAEAELSFVAAAPGANSFAIEVGDIDAAAAFLTAQRFEVAPVVPDMVDPDGPDGPEPLREASWRDFHFAVSPVAGAELFFIQYPPDPAGSESGSDPAPARTAHANTARRLSAVWVAVPDVDREAEVYRRMGFKVGAFDDAGFGRIRTASLRDGTAILLVAAARLDAAYTLAGREGARIIGLSFEVGDGAAVRRVLAASEIAGADTSGPFGDALRVNATASLGLFIDFHQPAQAGP